MKKIGFVITSTGWGGLELNVLRLIRWLTKRNWEIILFTIKESRIYCEAMNDSFSVVEIEQHKKYFDFSAARKFNYLLKAQQITKLVVCDNRDLDFAFLTKMYFGKKLKIIYHQQMQIGVGKKDLLHTLRFSAIDYWIAPLHVLKEEVLQKTRVKAEKIKVIPLCTEIDKFLTRQYTKEEARMKLMVDPSSKLVGIIGRIDPKKGQLFLVKAIRELQNSYPRLELLIVGEPTVNEEASQNYYKEIMDFITKNNLTDSIHVRNFTRDVSSFFNAIDIFALASEGETFGMVTIEAMLSHVPIIATDSTGTPEILNYGELGYLYKPNDSADFQHKLRTMLDNFDSLDAMAEKAQKSASERFSHIYECEKIEELLEDKY